MKKKLLFTMLCIVSALGMNAQTDVTASFVGNVDRIIQGGGHNCANNHKLTNAGGSQGEGYFNTQALSGWHNFVANTAQVSHGVESWTGSAGGEGWILGRVMVLPEGKYTLKFTAMSTNQSGALTNTVVRCGSQEQEFKDQGTYDEYSFDIDVTIANTAYEFGIYQKNGGTGNWSVMGNISLTLNSTNVTAIDNSSVNAFTYSGQQTWHTNTWSIEGNTDNSKFLTPFHELWVGSGNKLDDATIKTSYTPTETGVYKVSAWVRAMNESGGAVTGAKIFVGDVSADACTGEVVYGGKGRLGTYTAMADGVSGTPFEYGFILENAEINWLAFKNVTITYLGSLPEEEVSALLAQVPTGKMKATVQSTLDGYVTALNTTKSVANYNALSLYLPTAQASANVYSNINTAISDYAAKAAALDVTGAAAYDASTVQTKYDNGTYETLAEAQAELAAAFAVAVKSQTTAGSDWTGLIANPGFEENAFAYEAPIGWTLSGTANGIQTQNNTGFDGYRKGTMFGERWSGSTIGDFDAYQIIENMPAGVYELKAVATFNGTGGYLYANDVEMNVTDAKYYSLQVALEANSTLRIGVKNVNSDDGSWFKCDDFTLTYLSAALPDLVAVSGTMNAEVAAAQTAALSDYNTNKTVENYNAAVAAIAAAEASVAAYADAPAKLAAMKELVESTNFYTAEALNNYYTNPKAKYDALTLTTEEANALQNPTIVTDWHASVTVDNLLLSVWDADPDAFNGYYINTWSLEGGNDGSGFTVPFFEYWTGDGNSLGERTLTATMEGLEEGDYVVSAWVRVRVKDGATDAVHGITLNANDGVSVDVTTGSQVGTSQFYLGNFKVGGAVSANGKLVVKFNVAADNNISWLSFKNVKYTKVEIEKGDMNRDGEFTVSDITALVNQLGDAPANGDVNGDGSVNAKDVEKLVNIILDK